MLCKLGTCIRSGVDTSRHFASKTEHSGSGEQQDLAITAWCWAKLEAATCKSAFSIDLLLLGIAVCRRFRLRCIPEVSCRKWFKSLFNFGAVEAGGSMSLRLGVLAVKVRV